LPAVVYGEKNPNPFDAKDAPAVSDDDVPF